MAGLFFLSLAFFSCALFHPAAEKDPLRGKTVCLDPGHGGTAQVDTYRVGPTGEREEWINLRVALFLRDLLREHGAKVVMTREADVPVPLKERALLALKSKADVFLSIHHNATADTSVNFPIVYFHGNASENKASVLLGRFVAQYLRDYLFSGKGPVSLVSDHTIFPNSGTAVLRHSYGIPGVIGEATFFTNPAEEARLKNPAYNRREAEAYLHALEAYFSRKSQPILPKYSHGKLPPFEVLQEAERMSPVARRWLEDFKEGKRLLFAAPDDPDSLRKALALLTRSARSFPDSYVARDCHLLRAEIFEKLGEKEKAAIARRRAEEYYVPVFAPSGLFPSRLIF